MRTAEMVAMPRPDKRNDIAVKIDAAIYHKAKMVASFRHIPLAELLSELLEKPVERVYQQMRELMDKQEGRGEDAE
jgi:hypothetical protein